MICTHIMPVITPTDRRILSQALPKGWLQMAVDRLDGQYSRGYISNVKVGRYENEEVMQALLVLARAEKARRARLSNTIKALAE